MPTVTSDNLVLHSKLFKCNQFDFILDRSGGMGDVLKAYDTRSNETVAVKIVKQARKNSIDECVQEGKQHQIATTCRHVINFIGMFYEKQLTGIVMEYAVNGSLDKLIYSDHHIPKDLTFRFLHEIMSGIHFLHNFGVDQRVLHRDIKPKNILLDGDLHVKISDFGTSVCNTMTDQWEQGRKKEKQSATTLVYSAPERLQNCESTSKMDIYSFAITSWEIVVREPPYPHNNFIWIRDNVLAGGRPNVKKFPTDPEYLPLLNIITTCWHPKIEYRPDAQSVKKALKSNCPFDYKKVASQVAKLVNDLPNRHGLNETMELVPLLDMVNSTFNQRTESRFASLSTQNMRQQAGGGLQFEHYHEQDSFEHFNTKAYRTNRSRNARAPLPPYDQQLFNNNQYSRNRPSQNSRPQNANDSPQSNNSIDRNNYVHIPVFQESQQFIPTNERSYEIAQHLEQDISSPASAFNQLPLPASHQFRMANSNLPQRYQRQQQSFWKKSAANSSQQPQLYPQSENSQTGIPLSSFISPSLPNSVPTHTSYLTTPRNQDKASIFSTHSQSAAPPSYATSQTFSLSQKLTSSSQSSSRPLIFSTSQHSTHNSTLSHQHKPQLSNQSHGGVSGNDINGKQSLFNRAKKIGGTIYDHNVPETFKKFFAMSSHSIEHKKESITQKSSRVMKKMTLTCLVLGSDGIGKENMKKKFESAHKHMDLIIDHQQHKVVVVIGKKYINLPYDGVIICFSPASRKSYTDVEQVWLPTHLNSPYKDAPVLLVMTQTEKMPMNHSSKKYLTEEECQALQERTNLKLEEYNTNQRKEATKVFKKAFTMAAAKL